MVIGKIFKISGIIIISLVVLYFLVVFIARLLYATDTGVDIRQSFCNVTNGVWKKTGSGISSYSYGCFYRYSDANKHCSNSSQCKGKCVLASLKEEPEPSVLKKCQKINQFQYNCKNETITAVCQEVRLEPCGFLWTYEDGIVNIYIHPGGCSV